MVEENNWFSDKIFSKYTFPIKKTLTDAEDAAFKFISNFAARNVTTIFDVYFYVLDVEHKAVIEIEKIVGRQIEFQVRYGFEEFPNFDKKIAQLPLHKFELSGETIYEHAESKNPLAYPDTDYNFPRIFTDQFDKESPQWEFFEGSINNYTGTVFLENEYDVDDDLQINRNIMQPMPSLLYILKTGFAEKGYTLDGDILDDPDFKNAFLYSLSSFYSAISDAGKQELLVKCDDNLGRHPVYTLHYLFQEQILIAAPGKYKISGNLFLQPPLDGPFGSHLAQGAIKVDGVEIGSWTHVGLMEKFVFLDLNFEVLPGQSNLELEFIGLAANYRIVGGTRVFDATVLDITVTQLTSYNPDGSANPTLITANEIDLTKCVPDVTFGDLYKAVKLWKNYGVSIEGNTVYINLVRNMLGKGTPKDLSHKEVMEPERTFNQGKTFELKFTEVESDDYDFPSIYIDHNGITQSPYVTKEGTEEIIIDAIPLPRKTENSVLTAHGFIDDNQKIQIILYNGLVSGLNVTMDPQNLMIPSVYENDYKDWIDFLLNSIGYLWTFNDFDINVADLRDKTTVFAYGIYHVVYQLSKKNVAPGIIQTEIETYSIE